MMRPRLLDLCSGAGGAAMGYHRAGFDVVGVDCVPQPRYPFEFHQADALTFPLAGFDAVHASPPCLDHTVLAAVRGYSTGTGWMLSAIRDRLTDWGGPWVIENVPGARRLMVGPLRLCGSEFDLKTVDNDGAIVRLERHRLFESNRPLVGAGGCHHPRQVPVAGVYGGNSSNRVDLKLRNGTRRGGYVPRVAVRARLMGIDWMTRDELNQAIPPAYTEFIGGQLIDQLQAVS